MAAVEGISLPGVLGSTAEGMTNAEIAESFDAMSGNLQKNSLLLQKMQQAMFDKRAEQQKMELQQKIYDQLRINYDTETGRPRGKFGKIKEKVSIGFERLFKSKWFENTSKAFKKMLDSEGNEVDNSQAIQTETHIINNEEETKDAQDYAWKEEAENSARNEPDCDEAGVQQNQEGTQDESGASDVSADPSGVDGVQGLGEAAKEEPKPKQTRARKPKKA